MKLRKRFIPSATGGGASSFFSLFAICFNVIRSEVRREGNITKRKHLNFSGFSQAIKKNFPQLPVGKLRGSKVQRILSYFSIIQSLYSMK